MDGIGVEEIYPGTLGWSLAGGAHGRAGSIHPAEAAAPYRRPAGRRDGDLLVGGVPDDAELGERHGHDPPRHRGGPVRPGPHDPARPVRRRGAKRCREPGGPGLHGAPERHGPGERGGGAAAERYSGTTGGGRRALDRGDSGAVGQFRAVGDAIVYPVGAPVLTGATERGYLVQWRVITLSRQAREQVSRLIGSDGHLFVGNAANDVWTDLSRLVEAPPLDVVHADSVLRYERPGTGVVLAAARVAPRTPWLVLVEFPRAVAIAPARLFLRQMTLIGGTILVLGLVAAWATSLTLTRPLARLTQAAETVAAGDYAQPVAAQARSDELG